MDVDIALAQRLGVDVERGGAAFDQAERRLER